MKILFSSYVFPPSIGGIEKVGLELAKLMRERGHDIVVMTDTPGPDTINNIPIIRQPSKQRITELFREADAVFGNHLSLRLMTPLVITGKKPHCILLHTHLQKSFIHKLLASFVVRRGKTFAVSKYLAKAHNLKENVIYNGYDSALFNNPKPTIRQFDFLFVGRLVSDKGIDLLVDAMQLLPSNYTCMVVGDGPDRGEMEKRAPYNMKFLGRLDSPHIAELMRQSKWVVIPSRWEEPFGLVAIEAIASGAQVLAANHGGLPEAVGPCGLLFRPNDIESLVMNMKKVTERDNLVGFTEQERLTHLAKFSYDRQVDNILQVLNRK